MFKNLFYRIKYNYTLHNCVCQPWYINVLSHIYIFFERIFSKKKEIGPFTKIEMPRINKKFESIDWIFNENNSLFKK